MAGVEWPGADVGRRFAEAWVADDPASGAALLDELAAFDGDDTKVSGDAYARYVEADKRLIAYEDWCAERGMTPVRWQGAYAAGDGWDPWAPGAPAWSGPGLRGE